MSKTIEIPDIAMWKENDSELAKYSIQELTSLVIKFKEQNKQLVKAILNQDNKIDRAIEELELWQPEIEALKIERDYLLDILRGENNDK